MGGAIADGILSSDLLAELLIIDSFAEKLDKYKSFSTVKVSEDDYSLIADYDFIILAVRPQSVEEIFSFIKPYLKKQFLISLLAGTSVEKIKLLSGLNSIGRIMPNLAAQNQESLTALFLEDQSKRPEIEQILSTFGKVVNVSNEDEINMITALSGSGIAYVFYYMQAMIDEAMKLGISSENAKKIIFQTFSGALSFGESVSAREFVNKIAVPGGTTEQAIKVFDAENLDNVISKGIQAALNRSRELAK